MIGREIRCSRASRSRRGVSRIEVALCVMALFIVFCGVVAHSFVSRDEARNVLCTSRLGDIGMALRAAADRDPEVRLVLGNYDPVNDGCPDRWSWVAAVRESVPGTPQMLHCPANPVRNLQPVNTLLTGSGVDGSLAPEERRNSETCEQLAALDPSNPEALKSRIDLVGRMMYRGMSSNYALSWNAGRVQPRVGTVNAGAEKSGAITVAGSTPWRLGETIGPLTLTQLESSQIPSGNLPLVSEAASSGEILQQSLTGSMKAGTPLGVAMTAGPSHWHAGERLIVPATKSRPLGQFDPAHFPVAGEVVDAHTADLKYGSTSGTPLILQDTRAWVPVHGVHANVLMADGAVKTLTDMNGDGRFNPGFPVEGEPGEAPGTIALRIGFRDGMCEINAFEIFTGTVIVNTHESFATNE